MPRKAMLGRASATFLNARRLKLCTLLDSALQVSATLSVL
jgi:hypothetical protein